ncbi:CBS domain-containing protein [Methylocella sp. CPCC 101449]|uniref:CBS domain-containing protein n=1 Tax=Methylocella sp. CPCC 101449 TaxID=2987531 RepID=UPI00289165F9|nr:CBS domain-containing protein [Methylocella sp. CPCC 101449]MDT2023020.1 CBS domain-containing protein [Methylocella sp. CPCC 101449]
MKANKLMTRDVHVVSPDQSIREVALAMAKLDAGSMPVGEKDRLVGMITDRDIVLRAVAEGLPPNTPVRDVMTQEVKYCFDDEEIEDICQNMGDAQIRRLPVVNRDKRLVGILSLGDIALSSTASKAGNALKGISQPTH